MKQVAQAVLIMVWLSAGLPARAQDTARESRSAVIEPILIEETLPEENGECNLQINLAYRATGVEPETSLPRLQLFCGFSQRFGTDIDVPMAGISGYGIGDAGITLKYMLHNQSARLPALVAGLETVFPTGNPDRGIGEGGVELQPFLAFLRQFRGFGIQGKVGMGVRHSGDARDYRTSYGGSLAVPIHSQRWAVLGEFTGSHSSSGEDVFSVSPGLHWSLGNGRHMGVGLPIALTGPVRRVGVVFQFQTGLRRAAHED